MRINKFVAQATGLSRRAADDAIQNAKVTINGHTASLGDDVAPDDIVKLNGKSLSSQAVKTIILNKPTGYVVSRDGQGSNTIYDLLPKEYSRLKPVGRLDKDSSGLLILTNDGQLANQLTHPSHQKVKVYEIRLDQPLQPLHRQMISDIGIKLDDGPSQLQLDRMIVDNDSQWRVTMIEGRNRQIRRTFAALGYEVIGLHRTHFGPYNLGPIKPGSFSII